jgi:hypothetical protein
MMEKTNKMEDRNTYNLESLEVLKKKIILFMIIRLNLTKKTE